MDRRCWLQLQRSNRPADRYLLGAITKRVPVGFRILLDLRYRCISIQSHLIWKRQSHLIWKLTTPGRAAERMSKPATPKPAGVSKTEVSRFLAIERSGFIGVR